MKKFVLSAIVTVAFAVPALAADLEVSGAFIRATPASAVAGAGFLTITNKGAQDDKLVAASADVSKAVELHTHIKDGEVMRMRPVESIAVPAHGQAQLKPGGDHIMFVNLKAPLKEGDKVHVTLTFEKGGEVAVDMPVTAMGTMAPSGGAMPMDHMMHK